MRRNIALMVVVVAVVALITSPTEARKRRLQRSQTHIVSVEATTTGDSITKIVGQYTSELAICLANRRVEVTSGPTQTLQSPYGSATADAQGRFEVTGSAPTDHFFAVYIVQERRARTVCKGGAAADFGQFPQ